MYLTLGVYLVVVFIAIAAHLIYQELIKIRDHLEMLRYEAEKINENVVEIGR